MIHLLPAFLALSLCQDAEINKAKITWREEGYNPIWDERLWFQVKWDKKEWNIYVHPDNVKVEVDQDLAKAALSAKGKSTGNANWHKLEATSVTLYVPNKESQSEWEKRLEHIRDGLRRGFAGMSLAKIESWNQGRLYVTVNDIFWNAGDPLMILITKDKVTVVVDEKIGADQRYVEAKNAKVFYKGNGRDPRARLTADSIVISVGTESAAEVLRKQIAALESDDDE